jgi:hypothetical protein
MKKIPTLILVAVLISLLVIPTGIALADKDFHTVRLELSKVEGAPAEHDLRNGMVIRTHAEGPINYYVMSVILNGAKPNTTYELGWAIQGMVINGTELPGVVDPITGDPVYTHNCSHSIETDKNGNGNLHYRKPPEEVLSTIPPGTTTIIFKVVLIEGGYQDVVMTNYGPMQCWVEGVVALETDWFPVNFDWD